MKNKRIFWSVFSRKHSAIYFCSLQIKALPTPADTSGECGNCNWFLSWGLLDFFLRKILDSTKNNNSFLVLKGKVATLLYNLMSSWVCDRGPINCIGALVLSCPTLFWEDILVWRSPLPKIVWSSLGLILNNS